MYSDVSATLAWLESHGVWRHRLVVYGFSLGAAAAIHAAVESRDLAPGKVIAEAPFASTEALLQDALLLNVPGASVTDLTLDNATEIRSMTQPYLWLHGTDDRFIYPQQGQIVFDNYYGSYGRKVIVPGANHDNLPAVMGLDNYRAVLLDFITR